MRPRHGRAVVSADLHREFDEAQAVVGQLPPEPEERHDAADSEPLLKNRAEGLAGVEELLAAIVGDRAGEVRRLGDHALLHQVRVDILDLGSELVEGLRNDDSDILHRLVLRLGSLGAPASLRSSMAELDVKAEIIRTRPNAPRDHRLREAPVLDSRNHIVLINAANLAEQNDHLALRVRLVLQDVVNESAPRVPITADSNAIADAVGVS